MTTELNETHDPSLTSWIASANIAGGDFPIQNLPFGVFRRSSANASEDATVERFRIGVAIGDAVLDIAAVARTQTMLADAMRAAFDDPDAPTLNAFMARGTQVWAAFRLALSRALRAGSSDAAALEACLVAQADVEHAVPATIGDYTDFYASVHHATNIGKLFRPDNPLLPNYKWVPIGYHGRASTIGVSGESFHRPRGQTMPPNATTPLVGPSKRLDYEFEVGIFIGTGNDAPIPIAGAADHVFGLCLLNDWSARDIQAWEYQPLGPFLSKSFATTISPWIVTMEALAPFRGSWGRPDGDPQPLPYLDAPVVRTHGALDIRLEASLATATSLEPMPLSSTTFRHAYWTIDQMVAHHTVNGCRLAPGDLFGSGTASGPTAGEAGALIELVEGGKKPLTLSNGETRTFLEDGDTVVLRAWCEAPGARRIGFGECRGTVLPTR
jgi:fumarylacetoacetase